MTRQVFHATLKFNHATSGKKMRKGIFILLSGAKFYEVNYPISELLRKMKHQQQIYTTHVANAIIIVRSTSRKDGERPFKNKNCKTVV